MTEKSSTGHDSEIVSSDEAVTLDELCSCCGVEADWIAGLVEYGAIEVLGRHRSDWQFTHVSLVRVAKAKRLERDLDLNTPGVALALDLLDQIEHLQARLKAAEAIAAADVDHD